MTQETDLNDPNRDAATALRDARAGCYAIAPISETFGVRSEEDAYAVAEINTQKRLEAGARIVGKKVGLTSDAIQTQLGVDQPDYGILFDDMELLDGHEIEFSALIAPRVEAELAFVLGRDLSATKPSWGEFLMAIEYVVPALEVVDSAIANWKLTIADTVADNASCGVYVLGNQAFKLGGLDLGGVKMQMTCDGEVVSSGIGRACLGHPLRAAYWLAQKLGELGQGLKEGEVILSGAVGPMVALRPGVAYSAEFEGMSGVQCTVSQENA